jgi:hypothetical protein
VPSEAERRSERGRVRRSTAIERIRHLLPALLLVGCPNERARPAVDLDTPLSDWLGLTGETTVLSYVQLGWTGTFDAAWALEAACRPDAAVPAGILAPVGDGRWRAVALGETRVPCGARDAVAVHVRPVARLEIDVPDIVHVGDTFSARVVASDYEGRRLSRNHDGAAWRFAGGVGKGRRRGCMDLRPDNGDSVLVRANAMGDARIQVALSGAAASVDVVVQP